jgi:hypothetical protein
VHLLVFSWKIEIEMHGATMKIKRTFLCLYLVSSGNGLMMAGKKQPKRVAKI